MSLLKKSDVKSHLSTRDRNGKSLYRRLPMPATTGFSGDASAHANASLVTTEPLQEAALFDTPVIVRLPVENAASKSVRT